MNIPHEIKAINRWCCFKYLPPDKPGGKPKKVPISPITGGGAKSNDPSTCCSFDQAQKYLESSHYLEGLMFLFSDDDGFAGIDLDNCVCSETLKIDEWAQKVLDQFDSYAEFSVSNTGFHILIKGKLPPEFKKTPDIEMYDNVRFFVTTGRAIEGKPLGINNQQEQLDKLHAEVFKEKIAAAKKSRIAPTPSPQNLDLDTNEIIDLIRNTSQASKFNSLYSGDTSSYSDKNGNHDHSASDQALCNILAFYCGGDYYKIDSIFRSSGLYREKWNRKGSWPYGEKTIENAVQACNGVFYNPEYSKEQKSSNAPLKSSEIEIDQEFILACLFEQEFGDADLFKKIQKEKYCFDCSQDSWMVFDNHWKEDKTNLLFVDIKKTLTTEYKKYFQRYSRLKTQAENQHFDLEGNEEALEENEEKQNKFESLKTSFKKKISSLKTIKQLNKIETVLKCGDYLGITGDQWDNFPDHIATQNGYLISLEDGLSRKVKATDYIRKVCSSDWKGIQEPCPNWIQFQKNICMDKDAEEMLEFKRRLLGLSIKGSCKEHFLPIIFGEQGRNGKETEFETLKKVLGDLAQPIAPDVVISSKTPSRGVAQPELYDLWGLRIGWISETESGGSINVSRFKHLSGGGTLKCRPLHGNYVSFEPTWMIFIFTNHKPKVPSDDPALWERLILIDYPIHFTNNPEKPNDRKKDINMKENLVKEAPGILAWLVQGCIDYHKDGSLKVPMKVLVDTEKYRLEEDVIECWLNECCFVCTDDKTKDYYEMKSKEAFISFKEWFSENYPGMKILGSQTFSKRMAKKLNKKEKNSGNYWQGICFKSERNDIHSEASHDELEQTSEEIRELFKD